MSKCEVENSHVWVCIPLIIIISGCISGSEMLSSGSAVVSHFHRGHKRQWGLHVKITAGQRAIFNRGAHTAKHHGLNTISAMGPEHVCGCHVLFPLHEKKTTIGPMRQNDRGPTCHFHRGAHTPKLPCMGPTRQNDYRALGYFHSGAYTP